MSSLPSALQSCDMLLIDGLHAFDFTFDDAGLVVECMDGRALKRWRFSAQQLAEAVAAAGNEWVLGGDEGEHRLVCMSALRASEDDDDELPPQDNGDR